MRMMSTQSPKFVKVLLMSMTESPVTQTADVAVKRACKKSMGSCVDTGRRRRTAPTAMSSR